jgi:hypothetical protein
MNYNDGMALLGRIAGVLIAAASPAAAQCWPETAKLAPADGAGGDRFGSTIAISGDTLVGGAWNDDDLGPAMGSVTVFERDLGGADAWGEARMLSGSAELNGDEFGAKVDIAGDLVVVGARRSYVTATDEGSAYVLAQSQFWYRNPFNTSNRKTSLSNAVEFVVQP